jgi:hypothetical protein
VRPFFDLAYFCGNFDCVARRHGSRRLEAELFDGVHIGQPFPNERRAWESLDCPSITIGGIKYTFRRGFAHKVTCSADDFADHADAMIAVMPVREVELTTLPRAWAPGMPDLILRLDDLEKRWPGIKFTLPGSIR